MQNAGEIVRLCEAALRGAAAFSQATLLLADELNGDMQTAAAGAAADLRLYVAKQAAATVPDFAEGNLIWCMSVVALAVSHGVASGGLYHPSALALAALSAGPGSKLQRRLSSLLCSMVKVGRGSFACGAPKTAAARRATARDSLVFDQAAAAVTATAMIAGAPGVRQPCPPVSDGGDDSQSLVASMLPSVYILGRCCIGWSQQLIAIAGTAPSCGPGGQFL
jgi:hypothetical protein